MQQRRVPIGGGAELVITWDPQNAGGGSPGVEGYLQGLANQARQDPSQLLEQVALIMRRSFRRNFEEGGRPPWTPLRPGTVERKQAALNAGRIPRKTPTGKIPRRLLQVDRATGQKTFGPFTMLIATGALRDSWCVKGSRGNVTDIRGGELLVGSQLTLDRLLPASKTQPHYLILTKKAQKARSSGAAVTGKVPVARIQEQGAPAAHIPARPVGVVQAEDLVAIQAAALQWFGG